MRYAIGTDDPHPAAFSVVEGDGSAGPVYASDLARVRLFHGLAATDLAMVFARLRRRHVSAQSAPSAHELKNNMFFAWSGAFRITIMSPAGAHVTMRTILPGGHFGEIAAYAGLPDRDFHLVVDEAGVLLQMPAALFRDLVARSPELLHATLTSLAHAAVLRGDRIYEFATLDMKLRLHAELLRLAAHHGREMGGRVVIKPAPTQDVIATQIGATREGITRQMKCLVEQGLVQKRRGEIVLLDVERLQAMLERASGLCISHQAKLDFC